MSRNVHAVLCMLQSSSTHSLFSGAPMSHRRIVAASILGSGAVRGRGDGGLAKRARVFEWGRGVLASALASGGLTEATAGVEFGEASAVGEATPAAGEAGGKIRIGVGNAATGGRAAVGSGFTSTTVTSEASIRRFSDGIETFGVPSPEVSNCSASRTM